MKVRFKQDMVFEDYIAEVEELARNESPKNTLGQKVEVDYMIAELSENFSSFLTKPQMQKLVKVILWVFSSNSFTLTLRVCHSPLLSFEIT